MSTGAGAAILGCAGTTLSADERAFFAEAAPLGFVLFARNVADPDQLRRLTGELRDTVGRAAPVLIDQEGGRVARLRPPHWRRWPAPRAQVAAAGPAGAGRAMYLRYRMIAAELREVGVDVDCAPVADIAGPATHAMLADRTYGSDAASVTGVARAVARGLLDGGVLPVLKHIPGHGRAAADSHTEPAHVGVSAETLAATDFAPFRALADLPLAMTAHAIYAALDPGRPATVSPAAIDVVRREIGFDGLLMTDDISMQALPGSIGERAGAALAAGCDAVLHCNGDMAEMQAVAAASGSLSPEGARRAEAALARRGPPDTADAAALEAEFERFAEAAPHG